MSQIQNLTSLANCTKTPLGDLVFLSKNAPHLYTKIPMLKKDGTDRNINAPRNDLKKLQKKLLNNFFNEEPISPSAFGWIKGKSRIDCVLRHLNKRFIYTADLSNCFPSIHSTRIYKLLLYKMHCSPNVAKCITRLTTYNYQLPQGAPTSPAIVNILLRDFDNEMSSFWKKRKANYSRFGDDMIVSSNTQITNFEGIIKKLTKKYGLNTNPKKFKTMTTYKRQAALGITINHKINIPREQLTKIKSILFKAKNTPLEKLNLENHPNFQAYLLGKITEIKSINPAIGTKLKRDYQLLFPKTQQA